MKHGVSTYSFDQLLSTGQLSLAGAIREAGAMGFDGVELANLTENYPYDPEELCAAAREAGVELCSWATSANFAADISAQETALRAEIDRAAAMGCKAVRTDIYHEDVPHPYAENVLAALRRLADYAQEKDVVLITENHGGYLVTPERLERLFQAVDHENFGLLCDFANFADANEDPARAVRLLKKHIRHVHVKDCHLLPGDRLYPGEGWYVTAGGDYWRCAIAGQGNLPLAQCMKTLAQSGYNGYLIQEFEGVEDCRMAIRAGLDYMKRLLAVLPRYAWQPPENAE